eukprot:TRINITY_DN25126_c0_g1_i1.p1 TRINITY_DN25126_c0_g1~~TRINITY_DN25126_c0_g1_i1.p1  ORF type:complete len:243 (+),score=17.14 TRINITY_DN25126_c0_g1_i1:53-730(+)
MQLLLKRALAIIEALLLDLRVAMLAVLGAGFDYGACAFFPDEASAVVLVITTLVSAIIKIRVELIAVLSVLLIGEHAKTKRTLVVFASAWCGFTSAMIVVLVMYEDDRNVLAGRLSMVVFLRLLELFVFHRTFVRMSYDRIHEDVLAYVPRICTLDDLQQPGRANQTDVRKLSCSWCLHEFCADEEFAVFFCSHVAHVSCTDRLLTRRALNRRLCCPMRCHEARR